MLKIITYIPFMHNTKSELYDELISANYYPVIHNDEWK